MPTERRTRFSGTPACSSSSLVSWRWVVEAGCNTQLRTSATCVSCVIRRSPSMNLAACATSPLMPKLSMPPCPLGRYFSARAWYLLAGSDACHTQSILGWESRYAATFFALEEWRSMRRAKVSQPSQLKKAFCGLMMAPMSRIICARHLVANCAAGRSAYTRPW